MTLPSPSNGDSTPECLPTPNCLKPKELLTPPTSTQSGKRKRRLSDTDGGVPAKRPHHSLGLPLLHSVSNPLPQSMPQLEPSVESGYPLGELACDIEDYDFSCKTPPSVTACSLDSVDFSELDYFRYNVLPTPEPSPPPQLLEISQPGESILCQFYVR